jgi:N-acetylglutamate synthase
VLDNAPNTDFLTGFGLGHNGGPGLEEAPFAWGRAPIDVYFAWKRAHEAVWKEVSYHTLLRRVEDFFAKHGLPAQFRISPLAAPGSIDVLRANGYSFKDEAVTMAAVLPACEDHQAVAISPVANESWHEGVSALNEDESKRQPAHLKSITSRMKQPTAFATIARDGRTVGYAVCAIHEGWAELGSIIIAPQVRGQGLGRALVTSLLHWAKANAATNAFLQVDAENRPAIALYRSLGFADCYRYSGWRRAG